MKKRPDIRAIFFDLGGVIVSGSLSNVVKALATLTRVSQKRIKKFYDPWVEPLHKGEITSVSLARKACAHFGITTPKGRKARRTFIEVYKRNKKISRPLLRLVLALRHRYTVGLISDIVHEHAIANARWGVFKYFKPVVLSCFIGLCKPGSAIFHYALRKAGIKPREAVFIDDLAENVRGAQRVGMYGVRFKNIQLLRRDLKKLGVLWN
ncbi:MAG: HAD family phosphatase [bacterium]|nr:HAD family phosphatase [bacterium]